MAKRTISYTNLVSSLKVSQDSGCFCPMIWLGGWNNRCRSLMFPFSIHTPHTPTHTPHTSTHTHHTSELLWFRRIYYYSWDCTFSHPAPHAIRLHTQCVPETLASSYPRTRDLKSSPHVYNECNCNYLIYWKWIEILARNLYFHQRVRESGTETASSLVCRLLSRAKGWESLGMRLKCNLWYIGFAHPFTCYEYWRHLNAAFSFSGSDHWIFRRAIMDLCLVPKNSFVFKIMPTPPARKAGPIEYQKYTTVFLHRPGGFK